MPWLALSGLERGSGRESKLPRAQDASDSSSGILQKKTYAEYKLSYARTRNALSNLKKRSRKSSVGIDATWALTSRFSISVTGRAVPWLGQWSRGRCSQGGPCHQSGLSTSSWRGTPRLAKSAGLCSDWTCDQLAATVNSVIFVTLLATNVVQWHAGLANHASIIVESVQQWSF